MVTGKFPRLPMQDYTLGEGDNALSDLIPDLVEPIRAFRAWRIQPNGKLCSVTWTNVTWEPREALYAKCMRPPSPDSPTFQEWRQDVKHCPSLEHKCGIYSVIEEDYAKTWAGYKNPNDYGIFDRCFGEVDIWGRVYCFDKGYLSEFAYPVSIKLNANVPEGVAFSLEQEYGISVSYY